MKVEIAPVAKEDVLVVVVPLVQTGAAEETVEAAQLAPKANASQHRDPIVNMTQRQRPVPNFGER